MPDPYLTYADIPREVEYERKTQSVRWWYEYVLTGTIDGQIDYRGFSTWGAQPVPTPKNFFLTIEQGTDFDCRYMTGSLFSYDAAVASQYPCASSTGSTAWATAAAMKLRMFDTLSSRSLTNDYIPFCLFATPGAGSRFLQPFPLRYYFEKTTKIRFDVVNYDTLFRDASHGPHEFTVVLHGYKIMLPGVGIESLSRG